MSIHRAPSPVTVQKVKPEISKRTSVPTKMSARRKESVRTVGASIPLAVTTVSAILVSYRVRIGSFALVNCRKQFYNDFTKILAFIG